MLKLSTTSTNSTGVSVTGVDTLAGLQPRYSRMRLHVPQMCSIQEPIYVVRPDMNNSFDLCLLNEVSKTARYLALDT